MRYFLLFSLCGLLVVNNAVAQKKKPQYMIKASVAGFTDSVIYMNYGNMGASKTDTAVVKNGQFTFKGHVAEPVPAMIFSRTFKVRIELFLDNTPITITANADSMYNTKVTGTGAVKEFEVFNQQLMSNRKRTIALFENVYKLKQSGDSVAAKALQVQADSQYAWEFKARNEYIATHPKSYIAAKELLYYTSTITLAKSAELYKTLDASIKASNVGQEIAARIALLSKVEMGKPATDFTQHTPDGKAVKLSAYKGRYVLIEFWASWCRPCRAENPNLLAQYNLYNGKGFDILGVSLDSDKNNWVKAIEKDGMPWTQVGDLKGWSNEVATLYGIRAVPASFLVDPQGVIIATGLRGEALNEKLKELFK